MATTQQLALSAGLGTQRNATRTVAQNAVDHRSP
jgi:hypothetical protein